MCAAQPTMAASEHRNQNCCAPAAVTPGFPLHQFPTVFISVCCVTDACDIHACLCLSVCASLPPLSFSLPPSSVRLQEKVLQDLPFKCSGCLFHPSLSDDSSLSHLIFPVPVLPTSIFVVAALRFTRILKMDLAELASEVLQNSGQRQSIFGNVSHRKPVGFLCCQEFQGLAKAGTEEKGELGELSQGKLTNSGLTAVAPAQAQTRPS